MYNILALDTTIGGCSVALTGGAQRSLLARNQQTSQLVSMVEVVMTEGGLAFDALDAYAVTIGPGSFTGVRIGLAFIRGLALAVKRPIYAISTLELLAFQAIEAGASGKILSAINAYRGQIYVQTFTNENGVPLAQNTPHAIEITDVPNGDFTLAGDADAFFPAHQSMAILPDAAALIRLAAQLPESRAQGKPAPLYIRPPDAKAQKGDLTIAQ